MSEQPRPSNRPKAYSYIRMSTEGQLKGDSLRRQVDRSRQYAAEHGLDLDETTTFNDIGVSAYRGKNLKQGALGSFLEAVRTKKIAKGSYLLVESLDRFSRDDVVHAHSEFLQLIKSGMERCKTDLSFRIVHVKWHKYRNTSYRLGLLREHRQRHCRRAAKPRDEIAPPHSIT